MFSSQEPDPPFILTLFPRLVIFFIIFNLFLFFFLIISLLIYPRDLSISVALLTERMSDVNNWVIQVSISLSYTQYTVSLTKDISRACKFNFFIIFYSNISFIYQFIQSTLFSHILFSLSLTFFTFLLTSLSFLLFFSLFSSFFFYPYVTLKFLWT